MKIPPGVVYRIGLTIVLMVACLGCGKKGDPTPVAMKQPQPAIILNVEKTAGAVSVRWSGRQASQRTVFKLERHATDPKASDCRFCEETFETVAEIDAAGPLCKDAGKPACHYKDVQVQTGWQYSYRLAVCDDSGRCEPYTRTASVVY